MDRRQLRTAMDFVAVAYRVHGVKGVINVMANLYSMATTPLSVRSKPYLIWVEPTERCNLRCKMCDLQIRNRGAKDLSLEQFKRILEKFPLLARINLFGIGEPFLNPYFLDMVSYATARGIAVTSSTNGTLITEDLAKKIVTSGMESLTISIDGASRETYEEIRTGACFDKVIDNIKLIVAAKQGRAHPKLSLFFVATRKNIHELSSMIRLAAHLGVPTVATEEVGDWGNEASREALRQDNLPLHDLTIDEHVRTASKEATELGIELITGTLLSARFYGTKKRRCLWPWWGCWVTADGFVTPCCHRPDPENFNLGNIFERSFDEIWNSPEYKAFRSGLKTGRLPAVCHDCPFSGYASPTG